MKEVEFLAHNQFGTMYAVSGFWKPDNRIRIRLADEISIFQIQQITKDTPIPDPDEPYPPMREICPNYKSYNLTSYGLVPGEATLAFFFALEICPRLQQLREEGLIEGNPIFME